MDRFTVSYDVWEEKFSVVRVSDFRRSLMLLSASSAESWCLDNIVISAFSQRCHPASNSGRVSKFAAWNTKEADGGDTQHEPVPP